MQIKIICQHQQRIDNVVLTDVSVKCILFRDTRSTISLAGMKCTLNMSYVRFALFTLPNFVHVMKFYLKL